MPPEEEKKDSKEGDVSEDTENGEDGDDTELSEADKAEEARLESLKKEHEVELQRERDRREKAERALAEKAFKNRKEKREEPDEDKDEDKPLTRAELASLLREERQASQKEILSSQIVEKAKKIAASDEEAALIVEIHKNRTFPDYLTIDEQLEEAAAIANRKRVLAQNQELKRSLAGKKSTIKTAGETTHRDSQPTGEPKLPPQDLQMLRQSGFTWDMAKKIYKKALPGSKKTLFYDPKNKKRWTA